MVYLVGAGPGDPGLISVRGAQLLSRAEVVVYDALANRALLDLAPAGAKLIDAGKRAGVHKLSQEQTNALLAEHALAGLCVVRLKGGDPYVFGRGSEEAMYLHERGVRVEVVPGITAAIAGPAAMGIPVTHRQVATTCTLITGHEDPTKPQSQVDYRALAALAQQGGTLCFYMAIGRLAGVVSALVEQGCDSQMPAAIVQWGTLAQQRSVRATLGELPMAMERAGLGAPAIVVIGQVAGLDEASLNWFEHRPLFGQSIVITRTRQQASELRVKLEELGAHVIETPTIAIEPAASLAELDRAANEVTYGDWLIFTSVNGVESFAAALVRIGADARRLAGVKVAVIGRATAEALEQRLCIRPDLVPDGATGEALAQGIIDGDEIDGRVVHLWQAEIARPVLAQRLSDAGGIVSVVQAYRTVRTPGLSDEVLEALGERRVNWLTFTSGSTARNFFDLLPDAAMVEGVKIASIGPVTSQVLRELGWRVDVEAEDHDIPGLVAAIRSVC